MPIQKTKKILVISFLLALLSISVFVFMFFVINSLNESSLKNSIEIEDGIKKDESLFLIKKDLEDNKVSLEKISSFIVKPDEVVDFIQTIENLALNNGLKSEVKSVSFSPFSEMNSSYLELIKVKVTVIGEWRNVLFFIKVLESHPLKIDMTNISLNKFTDYTIGGKVVPQWLGDFEFTVVKLKDK